MKWSNMLIAFSSRSSVRLTLQTSRYLSSQDYIDRELRYGCHNYKPLPVVLAKGKGYIF